MLNQYIRRHKKWKTKKKQHARQKYAKIVSKNHYQTTIKPQTKPSPRKLVLQIPDGWGPGHFPLRPLLFLCASAVGVSPPGRNDWCKKLYRWFLDGFGSF